MTGAISIIAIAVMVSFTSCWSGDDDEVSSHTDSRVNGYNVNLKGLKVSSGTLTPIFFPERRGYNLEVDSATGSIDITPEAADSSSTVTVNNVKVADRGRFTTPLNIGQNLFTIKVTGADGVTAREYNLSVCRVKDK